MLPFYKNYVPRLYDVLLGQFKDFPYSGNSVYDKK
jgi:hypothetical protein